MPLDGRRHAAGLPDFPELILCRIVPRKAGDAREEYLQLFRADLIPGHGPIRVCGDSRRPCARMGDELPARRGQARERPAVFDGIAKGGRAEVDHFALRVD